MMEDLLDPDSPEYLEVLQEINKKFKNKNMLYSHIVSKTVSTHSDLLTNFHFSASSCPAETTAPSASSKNCCRTSRWRSSPTKSRRTSRSLSGLSWRCTRSGPRRSGCLESNSASQTSGMVVDARTSSSSGPPSSANMRIGS